MPILHHGPESDQSPPAVDRITDSLHGFAWGPMLVTRMATLPKSRRCLGVSTDAGRQLEIYVSATGTSVVVFLDGERLT